jgi:hypothetical protein
MAKGMKIDEEGYKIGEVCWMYAGPRTVLDNWTLRSTRVTGHFDLKKLRVSLVVLVLHWAYGFSFHLGKAVRLD